MENEPKKEMKKSTPLVLVILVLLLIIAGFTYDKWGKGILPASVESPSGEENTEVGQVFEGDIQIGSNDAPVTIVEYYSYFCGYCELFDSQTKPEIIQNYISTGKAKLIYRPFPPFELGMAVFCANDQGKFTEYHDALFEKASEVETVDDLKTIAGEVGLDQETFNTCFDSEKYYEKAQELYEQGQADFEAAGIPEDQRGTPSFFINGEAIVGALPYDSFVEVIESKLSE